MITHLSDASIKKLQDLKLKMTETCTEYNTQVGLKVDAPTEPTANFLGGLFGSSDKPTEAEIETLKKEAEAQGLTLEQYQAKLEKEGKSEKAGKIKSWLAAGGLSKTINEATNVVDSVFGLFGSLKGSSKSTITDPNLETDNTGKVPVYVWIVLGVIALLIIIFLIVKRNK
ncbi:hypothetical protein MYP_651 [Sporocytophaga myxococcoides]|uniref:Uncharacterized protein n=1 Tax=Sporocytophaga myxococcoides TaxID=153721 RepID=A0A098LAG5_9BACT|nr:hypothetical protein [Sporocytophaga myxococcoides]GAL83424.1 hypothetical protein MYP_651 [Sporocytophaga myxococcoides]